MTKQILPPSPQPMHDLDRRLDELMPETAELLDGAPQEKASESWCCEPRVGDSVVVTVPATVLRVGPGVVFVETEDGYGSNVDVSVRLWTWATNARAVSGPDGAPRGARLESDECPEHSDADKTWAKRVAQFPAADIEVALLVLKSQRDTAEERLRQFAAYSSSSHGMPLRCPYCKSTDVDNVGDGEQALCMSCRRYWKPEIPLHGKSQNSQLECVGSRAETTFSDSAECHECGSQVFAISYMHPLYGRSYMLAPHPRRRSP